MFSSVYAWVDGKSLIGIRSGQLSRRGIQRTSIVLIVTFTVCRLESDSISFKFRISTLCPARSRLPKGFYSSDLGEFVPLREAVALQAGNRPVH